MDKIDKFIRKVKVESGYRKFVNHDIIDLLSNHFNENYKKEQYPSTIDNPLDIALQFYKDYNYEYYNLILNGIKSKDIIIDTEITKSYVNTINSKAYIKLNKNDADIFMLVHEYAHFIDRQSVPLIIPDNYWFFSETFAFYFEKQLELWLDNDKYKDLILERRNNRMFFESRMMKAINYQLYYEDLYKSNGDIKESDIDLEQMNFIMRYDTDGNTVNCLLQYPIANIISETLVKNNLLSDEKEFVSTCLNIDLYGLLDNKFPHQSSITKKATIFK